MRTGVAFALVGLLVGCATNQASARDEPGKTAAHEAIPASWSGGRLFISPMGEPFRRGDHRGVAPLDAWFTQADADHNGRLTAAEMRADAVRFFATLDLNGDGEIDPDEIEHYETIIAPEVSVIAPPEQVRGRASRGGGGEQGGHGAGSGRRGGPGGGPGGVERTDSDGLEGVGGSAYGRQGAARYGLLDIPEPVIAADTDLNRGVSRQEFTAAATRRFLLLDRDGDGVLTLAELKHSGSRPPR